MGRQARARRKRAAASPRPVDPAPQARAARRRGRRRWLLGGAGGGLVVGALLRFTLCAGDDSDPPRARQTHDAAPGYAVAETEPNDEVGAAQRAPGLPLDLDGTIAADDRDVFRVIVAERGPRLLRVAVDGPPGLRVEVTRDGATSSAITPGTIAALGATGGEYVVVIAHSASASPGAAPIGYRLHVSTQPWTAALEWEPNDAPEQATRLEHLPLGVPPKVEPPLVEARARGWWSRPADVDCFELALTVPPAGAVVRLVLTPPAAITARLRVVDTGDPEAQLPRQTLVEVTGAAAGLPVVVPALGARAWEPSYVVCTQAVDGALVDASYSLEASLFTPAGAFEFEPNDLRANASALPRGETVAGHLPRGDVDLYRLSAGPEASIEVSAEVPAGVAAELIATDEAGGVVARRSGQLGERLIVTAAGIAFVELRTLIGGSDANRYHLTARGLAGDAKP